MSTLLFLALPVLALAAPSPELVRIVRNSLHPGITVSRSGVPVMSCEVERVDIVGRDPVTNQPRHVHAAVYSPERAESTVLVFPPTGGMNPIDQGYARQLCKAGIRAAILVDFDSNESFGTDLAGYDRTALRTLSAAEHLLEYLHPAGRVGLLGTSLGGIQAAFVLGFDPRITAAVFVVAGDGLPEILANSSELRLMGPRNVEMRERGLRSIDEYQRALEKAIHIEPSTFANFSGRKDVQFYVGTKDTTVPTKNQFDLVRAFHGSDVTTIDSGHIPTVLRVFAQHADRIVKFFGQKL